mmetsp:Transcript_41705/g.77761  ORF Transcript_41705/g.77761 Transcript_41705/m.77761 type:complete len:158 (-) Transcript_41705:147-620(-)
MFGQACHGGAVRPVLCSIIFRALFLLMASASCAGAFTPSKFTVPHAGSVKSSAKHTLSRLSEPDDLEALIEDPDDGDNADIKFEPRHGVRWIPRTEKPEGKKKPEAKQEDRSPLATILGNDNLWALISFILGYGIVRYVTSSSFEEGHANIPATAAS